ncbi:MAG: S1 RNA-binding domain-containing protein, partial [Microcoleus sp. SIO2G3]|nr:S1 RNA-binding domain-containing protein [Microcoleus sp. SIO2G3]
WRSEIQHATFQAGIQEISDLKPGMELEGIVTNVANFGAFVDVGVHQDGLVHVSQLADRFVSDPKQIVRVGQVVKVRVLEVDEKLKRISLSMRSGDVAPRPKAAKLSQPQPQPKDASIADLKAKFGRKPRR